MSLRFRPIEREDLVYLQAWRNLPEIRNRCREYRLLSMENQINWFESLVDDKSVCMFAVESESHLIGVCGLIGINWVDRHAELSIYVGPEVARRTGNGKEIVGKLLEIAFTELNLNRIWLECYEFNQTGLRLFESCGFITEGILKNHVFKMGKYCSSIMMGILKSEWEKSNV